MSNSTPDPNQFIMSGTVLRLMLRAIGVTQASFAKFCKGYKDKHGFRIATSAKALHRATETRRLPDIYRKLLREFLGNELYEKWLDYFQRNRPDLFSKEPPI